MQLNLKVNMMLILTFLLFPAVAVFATDIHKMWDDRCVSCHGHAGEFSRKFLKVTGSELQGRHHTHDLRLFLNNHYLSGHDVEPVYNMLLAQVSILPRFKNECSRCHENAATFVRESFTLEGGSLNSIKLKIPVRDFLSGHRNLQPVDIDFFMEQFNRIMNEIE